ncbi:HAD family hydrolase [Luteolibacter algae]|uniref:HAD family hydrolase n=1 Tax=Luteolibacter algae TaxID=454151 RepID=A0ABW5DCC5_9BACT
MLPSAVLFDFDGVLVDTEWAIYQAWLRTFQRHGQNLPLSLYTRCIGSDFDAWSPKLYLEDLTKLEFDWIKMDEERQVEIRADLEKEGAIPGVIDVLEELETRDVPLAVVSSSSHDWVDGWLEKLDLRRFFREVVCKGDAPRIKPAPDLYLAAAEKLGLEPGKCLVIEDSLNGLNSAKAAGMDVWVVPNRVTRDLDFGAADKVLTDYGQMCEDLFKV